MWLVKYFLFFSSAIVSVVGAGAVIAGVIVFLIFDRLLPVAISKLLRFEFLEALPMQLAVLGSILCLSTLIGCCGAILKGNVGKWLLITYTIELTAFVALNILIAMVIHLGHQKTVSTDAVASGLTMAPRPDLIDANLSDKLSSPLIEADDKSFLVRQRRSLWSNVVDSTKGMVHGTTNAVGEQFQRGKDLTHQAVTKVSKKVVSGTSVIGDALGSAVDTAQTIRGGLGTAAEATMAGVKLATDASKLVYSLFKELNSEEEEAVKWIRPILGRYTGPVFRLTKSKVVMSTWAIIIGVEIFFIFLNIYLSTTKNQLDEPVMNCEDFVLTQIGS